MRPARRRESDEVSASLFRAFAQLALYAGFAVVVATFSAYPPYARVDPGNAVVKLSFSHAGAHREACRTLSSQELAALAPNMRSGVDCPRERVPVTVELDIDGERVYHAALPPSGLAGDGQLPRCTNVSKYPRAPIGFGSACATPYARAASTTSARPTSGLRRARASSSTSGRSWADSGSCRPAELVHMFGSCTSILTYV